MDLLKIGRNISYYRKKIGYTQAQLAEKVGLSNTHISHIETGDGTMSLESLIAISEALQITPDNILLGNFDVTPTTAARIFQDLTKEFGQDEFEYIFEMISLLNSYRIIKKKGYI